MKNSLLMSENENKTKPTPNTCKVKIVNYPKSLGLPMIDQ